MLAVLEITVHVPPPFVEDSHWTIGAEFPLNVNVPLAEPAHEVVTAGERVPPFGAGSTVTVTVVEAEQPLASVPVTV